MGAVLYIKSVEECCWFPVDFENISEIITSSIGDGFVVCVAVILSRPQKQRRNMACFCTNREPGLPVRTKDPSAR